MSLKKSTQFTVFVRFHPALASLRRHHAEQWFAGVGPIKKSSLIHQDNKVYGFIKYTCQQDAEKAAKEYNEKTFSVDGESVQVQMALAQDATASAASPDSKKHTQQEGEQHDTHEVYRKKACRVILRNLAFSANEKDIRKALAPFGPLTEVHIPTVAGAPTHRGFAFCTFERAKDAHRLLQTSNLAINKRPVQVAHSLNKAEYDLQQQQKKKQEDGSKRKRRREKEPEVEEREEEEGQQQQQDDQGARSNDEDGSVDDSQGDVTDDDSEDSDSASDNDSDDDSDSKNDKTHNAALVEKRALFVRNLPFDATRHDLFELFRKYGKIESIYICKGENGIPKGTAFVNYAKPAAAQRAIQAADTRNTSGDDAPDDSPVVVGTGVLLKGRLLLVDLAVDKETASTLTLDKKQSGGKDRRNMYLRTEGRVDDPTEWESLPETDKEKRQRAWSDKNTKLKSPLFFINPTRLSVRNLAKHVDEATLKKLFVTATLKGLENKLVTAQDQIALWKASGEMTTREILARIQGVEEGEDPNKSILPEFDTTNVKRFIPSVFIDRDFTRGNPKEAPSRGFGFAQFEHHVHALACLRELNNNPAYTEEFVAGGSRALQAKKKIKKHKKKGAPDAETSEFLGADGQVKIPRLIVEFTVENKVKARQQLEHRVQQEANALKQKLESSKTEKRRERKKKRGAKQRENRRKAREEGVESTSAQQESQVPMNDLEVEEEQAHSKHAKPIKPPKKKPKADPSETKFNELVETYKRTFVSGDTDDQVAASRQKETEKRWFE